MNNEDQGAGSGTGCVRALSLMTCVRACAVARVRGCVVACLGCACTWVIRGGPPQLQEVWVRLLEVVEGAEKPSLDVWRVLLREVG